MTAIDIIIVAMLGVAIGMTVFQLTGSLVLVFLTGLITGGVYGYLRYVL